MSDFVGRISEFVKGGFEFFEDIGRPSRRVKSWLVRKSHQRIGDRHWSQHTSVQDRDVLVNPHLESQESFRTIQLPPQTWLGRAIPDADVRHASPCKQANLERKYDDAFPPCDRESHSCLAA